MATSNKTIKNVPNTILARFTQIKADSDLQNDTETFVKIITEHGAGNNESALKKQIQDLTEKLAEKETAITTLTEENTKLTEVNNGNLLLLKEITDQQTKLTEERTGLITANTDYETRIETLENQLSKKIELTGNQFIASLNEDTFKMARKCRKYYMSDNKVMHEDEYPNHLINTAIPYYLKRKHEDIVNP